jgi:hypothetical protein
MNRKEYDCNMAQAKGTRHDRHCHCCGDPKPQTGFRRLADFAHCEGGGWMCGDCAERHSPKALLNLLTLARPHVPAHVAERIDELCPSP